MTAVNTETGEVLDLLDEREAERLTQRIALKLDAMADTYAGVMPLIREAIERRAYLALGYDGVSAYVSDRFGDTLAKLNVGMRREVVHELTEAGMSTRAIAPVVGVSHMTVKRDQAGVTPVTPQTPAALAAGATPPREAAESPKVAPAEGTRDAAASAGTADATATTPGAENPGISRPPVVGLDGKTYTRPALKQPMQVDEAEWDAQDRAEELAANLASNLSLLFAVTDADRRAEYIANWRRGTDDRPVLGSQFVTPKHMRELSAALLTFADEWENAHA